MDSSRLTRFPLFADLDEETLAAVAQAANERDVEEGEQLAAEGDFGHALFAIEDGTAEVSSDERSLRTLGPGDVFGEIAVVASGRRTATVTATSPMRLVVLFKRDVWALEKNAPAAAQRLREQIENYSAAPSAD